MTVGEFQNVDIVEGCRQSRLALVVASTLSWPQRYRSPPSSPTAMSRDLCENAQTDGGTLTHTHTLHHVVLLAELNENEQKKALSRWLPWTNVRCLSAPLTFSHLANNVSPAHSGSIGRVWSTTVEVKSEEQSVHKQTEHSRIHIKNSTCMTTARPHHTTTCTLTDQHPSQIALLNDNKPEAKRLDLQFKAIGDTGLTAVLAPLAKNTTLQHVTPHAHCPDTARRVLACMLVAMHACHLNHHH